MTKIKIRKDEIEERQRIKFQDIAPILLPDQYRRIRDGSLTADPVAMVTDRIRDALRPYAQACLFQTHEGAPID